MGKTLLRWGAALGLAGAALLLTVQYTCTEVGGLGALLLGLGVGMALAGATGAHR